MTERTCHWLLRLTFLAFFLTRIVGADPVWPGTGTDHLQAEK